MTSNSVGTAPIVELHTLRGYVLLKAVIEILKLTLFIAGFCFGYTGWCKSVDPPMHTPKVCCNMHGLRTVGKTPVAMDKMDPDPESSR